MNSKGIKTGASVPYGTTTLDEFICPTCSHRWFEFSDDVHAKVCPSCGTKFCEWFVFYNTDSFCDSFKSSCYEQAQEDALDALINWSLQERDNWVNNVPTSEQIESWNHMIESSCVTVCRRFPAISREEYEEIWRPSDSDLDHIGWVYYEKLKPKLEAHRLDWL